MQRNLGYACRCRFGRLLQAHKVAHGGGVLQGGESSSLMSRAIGMNVKVRQGSSTSSWDVGNPPTEEKNPGNAKSEQDGKASQSIRPEKVQTPSLEKEYSARDLFHDKARETEERLSQKNKESEAQVTKE